MPDLNYSHALGTAKRTMNSWKFRCLTPIGKITVIKSLILSKFTHLFSTLPASEGILNDINKMLFNYLLDRKPDKIKIEQICSTYLLGLKMTNIFNFEKSMKMKWLKIAIMDIGKHWLSLLLQDVDLKKLASVGIEYCESLVYKLKPFWKAVFMYYNDYIQHLTFKTAEDILTSSIWYNTKFGTKKYTSLIGTKMVYRLLKTLQILRVN